MSIKQWQYRILQDGEIVLSGKTSSVFANIAAEQAMGQEEWCLDLQDCDGIEVRISPVGEEDWQHFYVTIQRRTTFSAQKIEKGADQ